MVYNSALKFEDRYTDLLKRYDKWTAMYIAAMNPPIVTLCDAKEFMYSLNYKDEKELINLVKQLFTNNKALWKQLFL